MTDDELEAIENRIDAGRSGVTDAYYLVIEVRRLRALIVGRATLPTADDIRGDADEVLHDPGIHR